MRKTILLMTLALVLAACAPTDKGGATTGDTVALKYIGTFENGTLFDTNVQSVAEEHGVSKSSYEPLRVTLGQGQVIQGFEDALMGMELGEKKTITLPPAQAYGKRSPAKSFWIALEEDSDRSVELQRMVKPTLAQMQQFGADSTIGNIVELPGTDIAYEVVDKDNETATLKILVEEGDQLQLPNTPWNSTVTDIGDETYMARQDPPNGSIANTQLGPARFIVEGDTLKRVLLLEKGAQIQSQQGVGRVKEVNETHALIDFNHPLAGQTLVFEIEVLEIN